MFARLRQPSRSEQIRNFFWPKIGWKRWFLFVKLRLIRMKGGPHIIAGGFACGVAFSFTPLIGLHIVLAIISARILKFNAFAAAFGTLIGNPITLPFIWLWTFQIGKSTLGFNNKLSLQGNETTLETLSHLFNNFTTIFFPMLVGGLILFPFFFIISYFLIKRLLSRWQKNLAEKTLNLHSSKKKLS